MKEPDYAGPVTDENISHIFRDAADFMRRELRCGEHTLYAYAIDGLIASTSASECIFKPITRHLAGNTMAELYQNALTGMIYNNVAKPCDDLNTVARLLVNGFCVVLFPSVGALAFGVRTPDKRGTSSGVLMMGFGASALILGNAANALFKSTLGWRTTYVILGIAICIIIFAAALLLQKPAPDMVLPQPKTTKAASAENFERKDYTSAQMLSRPSFWMAFVCISFLAAVGSSVISFAKDLALSVNAPESMAVSLVGVLSVCNGLGRILTGALFDSIGRRKTMLCANILTICAATVTLLAVSIGSLPLCITGLVLTGMSYGACPTITAAFTSSFFGMKYFSTNMALMTFTVMGGSLIATASNKVLELTGGYTATFMMLLALTVVAFVLNVFIKNP